MNDEDAITAIKSGNPDAFEYLYKNNKQAVTNLVANMLNTMGNTNDADDYVQEIFTKVYSRLNQFKGQSKFSTWLYRIAINYVKDLMSAKTVPLVLAGDLLTDNEDETITYNIQSYSPDPSDVVALHEAVQKLKYKQRQVYELSLVHGYSISEVATLTGKPEAAIKGILHRVKKHLKKELTSEKAENSNGSEKAENSNGNDKSDQTVLLRSA